MHRESIRRRHGCDGIAIDDNPGGAFSSPNAIRSGIWPTTDYAVAAPGIATYVLNAVTAHSGMRSVMIEDSNGVNYFVEFRNQSAEDAAVAGWGCEPDSCAASTPGVRVMRADFSSTFTSSGEILMKGGPGDDTYLFGHLSGGVEVPNYHAGEQFHSQASGGVTIHVDAVTATTATMTITRPPTGAFHGGKVAMLDTVAYDDNFRVGDTLTAMISAEWTAENYAFQWFHTTNDMWGAKVAIAGATHQNYVLTDADLGEAITIRVIGTTGGSSATAVEPGPQYSGIGPVLAAPPTPLTQGSVTIDASSPTFRAVPVDFGVGATYHYIWKRDGGAIAGAAAVTYTPTTADRGHLLSVSVTATKSGSPSYSDDSPQRNYTLTGAGILQVTGSPTVGQTLGVSALAFTTVDGAASPTLTYQWYRNAVAIAGSTASTYLVKAADLGTTISVRQTATKSGFIAQLDSAVASSPVQLATIAGTLSAPVVAEPTGARLLASSLPVGAVTELGVTTAYQWFRAVPAGTPVAISGAVGAGYTLGTLDIGKSISVRYTITKAGFASYQKYSVGKNYSVTSTGAPVIGGVPKVGRTLTVSTPSYSSADGPIASPLLSYQWYRAGVAVTGAAGTGPTYLLTASDYAKAVTVRVTGTRLGYLGTATTSAATAKVGKGDIQGTLAPTVTSVVSASGTTFTLTGHPTGITELGTVTAYQWYRNGVAIAKAIKPTYVPTAVDYGKTIAVRTVVSKLDYTTLVATSAATDYSLKADYTDPVLDHFSYLINPLLPRITGEVKDGATLTAVPPKVTVAGAVFGDPAPTVVAYQWYRTGTVIPGATGQTYLLVPADHGKGISVTVRVSRPGYLPVAGSSPRTQLVAVDSIPGFALQYHVALEPDAVGSGVHVRMAPDGDGMSADPLLHRTFQWYRDATPIVGKTTSSYLPTAADYEKHVWVRETTAMLGSTTVVKESVPVNYSLHAGGTLAPIGVAQVGKTLSVAALTYSTDAGPIASGVGVSYQWLRSGVAIAGALGTAPTYTLVAADYTKVISVRVTAQYSTYLPAIRLSTGTAKVIKGVIVTAPATVPTVDVGAGSPPALTASWPIAEVGTAKTYQWYRAGVAITGATHIIYQAAAADIGKAISVRVTAAKLNYTSITATSTATDYSLVASGPVTLSAPTGYGIGQTLSIAPRTFQAGGSPRSDVVTGYQWFRNGVAIPAALHGQDATYTPVVADTGKAITVKVTVTLPGFIPTIGTSGATPALAANVLAGWNAPVTVTKAVGSLVLSASSGVTTTPAATAYQWYRGAVAIVGGTHATYTLVVADTSQLISVRVSVSASTYTTVVKKSVGVSYTVVALGLPTLDITSPTVGTTLHAVLPGYTVGGSVYVPDAVHLGFQWLRNGTAIAGATASTYPVVAADHGKRLSVRVTVRADGYLTLTVVSALSAVVG